MLIASEKNAMFDVIACCFCRCSVIANVETARQSRHCCGISAEAFNGSLEPLHRQTNNLPLIRVIIMCPLLFWILKFLPSWISAAAE